MNRFFNCLLPLFFSTIIYAQSQSENYIKTTQLLEPVDITTFNANYNSIKKIESVTYFDGFGKAKQSIAIKQTTTKKDIVQHVEYDQFGRASKQYLALPTSQNSGEYITNAQSQITSYYQNTFADQHPFSETEYDNSPLNRKLESSAPGNTWQLLSNSDSDHTTKYDYEVNGQDEVLLFEIVNETENPFQISFYPEEELLKNVVKNENWTTSDGKLNTKELFTDKNGKKIAEFNFEEEGNNIKKLSTYYVYDNIGNLCYVMTPKAIENLYSTVSITPFNQNFDWTNFVVNPASVSNGSGNVNVALDATIISGENYGQLTVDFNLLFENVPQYVGTVYLEQGNIVSIPANNILPANQYLFSVYKPSKYPILIDEPLDGSGGSPLKSRYEYSIKNGFLFCEFIVGTEPLSPTSPFLVASVDRTIVKNYNVEIYNESVLNDLCFRYKYDQFNRQIEQKVPGKEWEYMVYDQLDRSILTQDANLKTQNQWLFNKYDVFGRVVYSGIYTNSASRAVLQTQVDNFINASSNKANIETKIDNSQSNINGVGINYTNGAFPVNNIDLLTLNYYDSYLFGDFDLPTIPAHILGQEVTDRTKGLLTATWTKTLDASTWTKSYTFYDKKGRVIYAHDKNHLGGYTQNKSKLDFRGKIEESITNHKRVNSSTGLTIVDRFEYDHVERPKKHYQKINGQEEELIAQNTYNELGQLEKKNLGGDLAFQAEDLYTDIENIDITGNIITKSLDSYAWNAGLATKGEIINDGFLEFEIAQNNKLLMVGLSNSNLNSNYTSINYAIYNHSNGNVYVRENGVNKGSFGTYNQGDIFRLERTGTAIQYKKNGNVFYTSTIASSGKLIGDMSILSYGASVKNLKISSGYTDIVGLTVSNITNNTQQIKKETGTAGWNAGLATVSNINQDSDGYLSYKISQTSKHIMVGLSQSNLNEGYTSIKYIIYHLSNGTLQVRENGTSILLNTGTTYQAGDEFSIERVGSNLHFKKNGDTFFTKSGVTSGSLIGDTSFHSVGGAIYDLKIQNTESGLQTIDYTYNIRGWLTNINDVNNLGTDLFAYNLKYDEAVEGSASVSNLYNGNIKQVVWKSAKNNLKKSYAFEYDKLNRFTKSIYRENNTLTGGAGKFETFGLGYDSNGNILGLRRTDQSNQLMDKLSYNYDGGNKLLSISDSMLNPNGFNDGSTSNEDYEYDVNGNLTQDLNKDIELIEYNHLDLVKRVTFGNGNKIEFTYDANGGKLQMKNIPALGSTTVVDYLGGFQYTNTQLQFFPTPEGYAANDNGTFKYVYQFKDHLGNNRVSFSDTDGDAAINPTNEILSNTDHYVMGLIHNGEFISGIGSNYNYKFQGKEKLAFGGYNMYDFGSRMYDPTVGRWFNTDPQNQFGSPYLAMGNNWVVSVDPNGEFAQIFIAGAFLGIMKGIHNNQVNGDDPYSNLGSVLGFAGKEVFNQLLFGVNGLMVSAIDFGLMGKATFNIPISDNFSLTVSPAFAFGNAQSIGLNLTGNLHIGDWTLSVSLTGSYYNKAVGTGKSGIGGVFSGGVTYDDGKTGFSLYTTYYTNVGGVGAQRVGGIGFRRGDFKFRYENDGTPFGGWSGDGGDSYKTAAIQFGIKDFNVGFNLFTGKRDYDLDPGEVGERKYDRYGRRYPNGFVEEVDTPYRLGALYFGYQGYRIGVDSEHIRHAIQTQAIHNLHIKFLGLELDKRQPGFKNQSWDWKPYGQFQTLNQFSLWN